jgi:hypothetical protein
MTGRGTSDPDALDDDVEDEPLVEAEAAAGAAVAREGTGETLEARIGAVIADLADVGREREGDVEVLSVARHPFAAVGAGRLEVALDPAVARAALATPDTRPSARGGGWVSFAPATPSSPDRFALDRAEAWIRLAHRRARERRSG